MEIFISGDLTTFAATLAENLTRNGHRVVVSDYNHDLRQTSDKKIITYDMHLFDSLYEEIFTAHTFDVVIHITPQQEDISEYIPNNAKSTNGELEKVLYFADKTAVKKFLLISSIEIDGDLIERKEDTLPQPNSIFGQIVHNAEQLCQQYAASSEITFSIIRIPFIYGPLEENTLLANLIQSSQNENNVEIMVNRHDQCDFLHVLDLANFVQKVIDTKYEYKIQYFNLVSQVINFDFLIQQLNIHFHDVNYQFLDNENNVPPKRLIDSENASAIFDWSPRYTLINEISNLINNVDIRSHQKQPFPKKLEKIKSFLRPFLVWIEVILGAFLMHMLTVWTNTIIEFKYIDYRLIYVVIIGSTHGLLFGIIAAILAGISALISWNTIGLDFALLTYNVENWIPFAVFFLAGAVTGYVYDKRGNEIDFEKKQNELIHEKYEFLYSLYNEIGTIKNQLREQLVGYRDSFGRFFRIANELNNLDEDVIFFKALEVLEDVMKNDQIAIYSIESTGSYGRLEVKSKALVRDIPKSLHLADYTIALESLNSGEVFQNKDLITNYPAYIAPIMNEGKLIGLVIIWEADFEQYNLYSFNLFKVITGLIQSSLVRAAIFNNAQTEKLYIPSTRIMKPDAFKRAIAIKKKMRRNKISNFQILKVERNKQSWNSLYEKLSKGIRADDVAGVFNEKDEFCYILLANADVENIPMIIERLDNYEINSLYLEDLESD